jgi:serine/threonine-protein kinase ULK4
VYCDLKPSTILIDGGGTLKYADFGLAKRVTSSSAIEQKPQQERRGTPFYMAPELFQDGVHSFASDLYSLGCVLYELASGSPPYVESSITELMQAVLSNPYLW